MARDPIFTEYASGFKPRVVRNGSEPQPEQQELELLFLPARLPDPTMIPPRPWLYGTQLLRGYVSVLVAPGGVGKTGYAMGVALSLTSGIPLFGEKIFSRVNVAVMNLEDPLDELERRLAALMLHHKVGRDDIEGRYYLYSADDRRLTIATVSNDGYEIVHPDEEAIKREIRAHNIGVLIVDPFAESHDLEENNNQQMIQAVAAWRRIARATGCAILLLHHVRKGPVTDIDAARGAKALTDSARVGLIMAAMTEEEADGFSIPHELRTSYVRLDNAKSNMARRPGSATWFELHTVELGNGTEGYPSGDMVAAISLWKPTTPLGDLTIFQCNQALDTIEMGLRPGVRYTQSRAGKSARWAGQVLMDQFGVGEKRAVAILAVWMTNHVLEARDYDDAEQRKKRSGLFVVDVNRPGVERP